MLLEISHETTFHYAEPVTESYLELRLTPLTDTSQHLLQHRQRVTPARSLRQYSDGLGNTVTYFNLLQEHEQVSVVFDSVVETFPIAHRGVAYSDAELSTPGAVQALHDYLKPTALTLWSPELLEFASELDRLKGECAESVGRTVMETIYGGFRYDGDVTTSTSTVQDVLRLRAGVCQDFTHLMIATCRYLGVPTRYVSGYILPEQEGEIAAASHAWCEVFCAGQGWLGLDPTHNVVVTDRHVRLGVGRDYRDVPPNRGVYRGSAAEEMTVHVRLTPVTNDDLNTRSRAIYLQPSRSLAPATRNNRKPAPLTLTQQVQHAQQQQQQQQQ